MLELFPAGWFYALLSIVVIDLVLAGDNAIVVALAARRLPQRLQLKAIVWGTVGAIIVRSAMTVGVVWLLKIPGLMLIGGLGLVWVAFKLLTPEADADSDEHSSTITFWSAMRTIVVADALMGIDNVLGVAGAANGSLGLVIIGLLISVPIVVLGSRLVLQVIERFPFVIYAGSAVLAYTAAHMIVAEPLLAPVFEPHVATRVGFQALLVLGVTGVGWWASSRRVKAAATPAARSAG